LSQGLFVSSTFGCSPNLEIWQTLYYIMSMAKNKKQHKDLKIYTLKIAYNENTDTIEYVEETIDNEFEYTYFEGEYVYILDYYSDEDLKILDDTMIIGES